MGVRQGLFNSVCGGCHGSVSGAEIDVSITPDALTSASSSASQDDLDAVSGTRNAGPVPRAAPTTISR
jgi:hypothetical protein